MLSIPSHSILNPFPPIPLQAHCRVLCAYTAISDIVDWLYCSVCSIMPSQFPFQSLHTAHPLPSPTMCRDQIPDEYRLHAIAPEIDIDNFTEGNFDFRRIGGDTE